MKFESGLSYKQLKSIVDADAIGNLSASVRKVGDRWQAVLNFQVADPNTRTGKRQVRIARLMDVRASGRGAKTKESVKKNELQEWKNQVIEDAKSITGIYLDPTNSVRKCVEDWIVKAQRRSRKPIRESTASNYRQIAKRIFRFPLADMQMIDLNTRLIQSMVDDLAKGTDGRKGLSFKSVKDTHALLSIVCADVLGAEKNPCKGVALPDGQPTKRTRSGKLNILTDMGVAKVMQLLDDRDELAEQQRKFDALSLGARIVFNTALRCEEVTALRWQDVDLTNGIVHITHVIERTETPLTDENGQYVRDASGNVKTRYVERDTADVYADAARRTKTRKSRRNLGLSQEVVAILAKRKKEVAGKLRIMPRDKRPSIGDLYVLGSVDGGFLSPRKLGKRWLKFAEENDVYGTCGYVLTLHGVRHTVGSQLAKTMNIHLLSRWLGHSSIATTEKYYLDIDDSSLEDVSMAAGELISQRPTDAIAINEHDRYKELRDGTNG